MQQKNKNTTRQGVRILALLLVLTLVLSSFTGFTNYNGFGTVYFQSAQEIFQGTVLGEQVGSHSFNGPERAYTLETDPAKSGLEPYVFAGEVRGFYTVRDMIAYAEQDGFKVVAAVNGDIFDTSTGVPKGTVIHNYNIVTSGYEPDRIITFDKEGHAAMTKTTLVYSFTGMPAGSSVQPLPESEIVSEGALAADTYTASIGYFNVPTGSYTGVHLYNRHYATSTRTTGSRTEVVVDCGTLDQAQLQVNKTLTGIVRTVNPNTSNTNIEESCIILSAANGSEAAAQLAQLAPGSTLTVSVTDSSGGTLLPEAKEALGLYYSLIENGYNVTTGNNLNPRTALGVKDDGSLLFYVVDGRQQNISNGLSLVDLANHMQALGCRDAYNLDGGGSSVFYARLPGIEERATLKNSPSQSNERRISNGILLGYRTTASQSPGNLHVYPSLSQVMPGIEVAFSASATNSLYEKADLPGTVRYDVPQGGGIINEAGLFVAGDSPGRFKVSAESNGVKGFTEVEVVTNISINPSVQSLSLEAGQEVDINVIARYGTSRVKSRDDLFTWSCDANIGTIDSTGKFSAVSTALGKQTGSINIVYRDKQETIPVTVGQSLVVFSDTGDHWAREYIGSMGARGLLGGVGNNMFMPDSPITRAQFLAMLAKCVEDLDISKSQPVTFKDVPPGEWYYNYVNWGFENGIVAGMDANTFAPDANITREQMTVMLCNYSRYISYPIPQKGVNSGAFADYSKISPWALDYVVTVVGGGLMNGMPDGSFAPQGNAKRAEAAKLMYVFCNTKDGITNDKS